MITDIVDYFSKLVDELNNNPIADCSGCYYFGAPLDQATKELQQVPDEDCKCTFVFITDYQYRLLETRDRYTNLINDVTIMHYVSLEVLKHDVDGKNTYNELSTYDLCESRWVEIYRPIQVCFTKENIFNLLCSVGFDFELTDFQADVVKLSTSNNYSGWQFKLSLKERYNG